MKKDVKLNFRITNSGNLIDFLKKIKLVDKSVILELENNTLFAKVRTPDKSVIKFVGIDISDVLEGDSPDHRIKIGIMEINKIIDVFKYFGPEEETFIEIKAQLVDDEYLATGLRFYSGTINISFKCADVSLLSYIEDNIQQSIHGTSDAIIGFPISKEAFNKIVSLTGIENNSEELLNFDVHAEGITIRGNSFQYHLVKGKSVDGYKKDETFTIYKNQFSYIDQENSLFCAQENRIVVVSNDSESKIAIGLVEM